MPTLPPEAKLWGELYALLCRWPSIQYGLASMPESDQPRLDDLAEKIIRESGAFSSLAKESKDAG